MGPGIVFASLAVGSGELILTPRAGALYGYALAWVALGTLVYKAAFTEGLARCTVATGNDIFVSFNSVPGPRGWVNRFVIAVFALEALAYGGIALAAGTAVNSLFPGIEMRQAAVGIVLLVPIIPWLGVLPYPREGRARDSGRPSGRCALRHVERHDRPP